MDEYRVVLMKKMSGASAMVMVWGGARVGAQPWSMAGPA